MAVKRDVAKEIELQEQLFHAQKMESLGVMAGAIAHDFNNLLMATLGNLELALTDRNLESKTRMAIENAIQASERSAELSHQMLIYSGNFFMSPGIWTSANRPTKTMTCSNRLSPRLQRYISKSMKVFH